MVARTSNKLVQEFFNLDWLNGADDVDWEWRFSPEGLRHFLTDVLLVNPAPYQYRVLEAVLTRKRVAVRGPHGLGKTAMSSWLVLYYLWATPPHIDLKIITTASAWRQLTFYTWPEIRKWAGKVNWSKHGMLLRREKEMLELSIKMPGKEVFAVASNNHAFIEGAHASRIVYLFDEAKAIPEETWDAAEGAFSTGEAYALAISTPGDPEGRFYKIHKREPEFTDWYAIHVTIDDALAAGRISPEWVEARRKQWFKASPAMWYNRVEGEFHASDEDTLIKLAWIEAANDRWREMEASGELARQTARPSIGCDPAEQGADKTVTCVLAGNAMLSIDGYEKNDLMETADLVYKLAQKYPGATVAIDTIGVGAGVFSRLRQLGLQRAMSVKVSEKATIKDRTGLLEFVNLRAAIWWAVRDALDPDGDIHMAIPPVDLLTSDLTAPKYFYNAAGKIYVESKDDMRERIGRSTDFADAFALAIYARMHKPFVMV